MTVSGSGARMLPTECMTPRRQLEMIEMMAELGGTDRVALSGSVIAEHLGLTRKTISRAAGFLTQAGLFQPASASWALTEVGLSLARLRGTDSARARLLLRTTGRTVGSSKRQSACWRPDRWRNASSRNGWARAFPADRSARCISWNG
ncbi:hypothetical protein [Streptomyces sp. NPDC056647]|uniref:hypothetical protein n=1 Tax=Streptomyces sp. NPDC056647 TaxID=3345890 RepID=UPI0036C45613